MTVSSPLLGVVGRSAYQLDTPSGRQGPGVSPGDPQEAPRIGDALERVLSGVLERQPGAGCEVAHDRRDPDLRRTRKRAYPGGDVDGHSGDILTGRLDLADVHAGPDLDTEVFKG